jgi:lambda repressor-like predicted transcriptional regulator
MAQSISNETFDMPTKPPRKQDWTSEYIKYCIRSKYGSMVALAVTHGMDPSVIKRALRVPYPKVEAVIAAAIGSRPEVIWPSRYDPELLRTNHRLWRRVINLKHSTADAPALVETDQAD